MNFFLYLLTAILYILSFPNFTMHLLGKGFNLSWLAWVCLVPFIIAVDREKEVLSVIKGSFLCGWIIFLGGMYWLTEVTWLGYILLTFYMAWYIVLFGIICFYNKNFFIIPLAWTGLEFIKGNLGGGIPWLLLGSSQYKFPLLIQIANVTGVYGISFLVAMVNGKIAKRPFAWRSWILVLCVLGSVIVYGKYETQRPVARDKVRIGVIQPNIPLDIKWDPQYTNWMVDRLIKISKKATPCDILIWPETAVPTLPESPMLQKQLGLMTEELGCVLIVGSQGFDPEKNCYNSAFLISKKGQLTEEYRKIHLVPFGEYVPFGEKLPFLKSLTPIQEEFSAGAEYTIFNVNPVRKDIALDLANSSIRNLKYLSYQSQGMGLSNGVNGISLAILICFEDIFPGLTRRFVLDGANILVNITNDAWFGNTAGPYQHAVLSVFRAVENRVSLVRATNTGLSCFISPNGEILETVKDLSGNELLVEGYAVREVVVKRGNTFYTKYGDIFSWGCIIMLICSLVRRKIMENRGESRRIKENQG